MCFQNQKLWSQQSHGEVWVNNSLLGDELIKIVNEQPELSICTEDKKFRLFGRYHYALNWQGLIRAGKRNVEVYIPFAFPETFPDLFLKEVPKEWSHIFPDGSACVATMGELIQFFSQGFSITDYFNTFVESYLFTVDWFEDYGTFPFGERQHGWEGLLSYYLEDWGLTPKQFRELALLVYENKYRGHNMCICGSNKNMRRCHGKKVLPLIKNESLKSKFLQEALEILKGMNKDEKK